MLLSPKRQTMWMDSQHYSKSLVNVPLPSQQAEKILQDLGTSCCSSNKTVQLEALKCWGNWINNQNPDDWKLNTVCYTAVRPLLTKKLQPLHKDVDVCKLKLSLMWTLLVKVQNIMQLEGPQYILEVFLQSCLTWLSSTNGDGVDNEVSVLIFQLLLVIFKKDENLIVCDKEKFPVLSTEIFQLKKVFHRLAEKFLSIFVHWRKLQDKNLILKIWNHFLEHCEHSCEHIPIPVWHKVFKLASQICSERSEPIKERLAFLHGSATNLKSVLLSSKFIDYGNLLTTPCEALLKKLVELCTIECEEFFESEMFIHAQEICQVLSDKSVAIGGYDLCIYVLDTLEEFSLRSLYWGVWCGLVHCYKVRLADLDKSRYTKMEMKFYRKLRGVAVNFELDKKYLREDCIQEIRKHISVLNITLSLEESTKSEECSDDKLEEAMQVDSPGEILAVAPRNIFGEFSRLPIHRKQYSGKIHKKTLNLKFDLIKDIFKHLDMDTTKSLLSGLFNFRFINPKGVLKNGTDSGNISLQLNVSVDSGKEINVSVSCVKENSDEEKPVKEGEIVPYRSPKRITYEEAFEEEVVSTPKTRSRSRAEEVKKEMENQKRKKRRSFEVLVQEIVRKNRLRKTEKNSTRKKSPIASGKKEKRNNKKEPVTVEKSKNKKDETPVKERKLRKPKNQKKEENKSPKNKPDGKLESYFKVITKKTGSEVKKEENLKKSEKGKKNKKNVKEASCCKGEEETERKGEIAWRQTSLKTMMNQNKKEKRKHGMKTRNKSTTDEKPKTKNEKKIIDRKEITKLSPFKEVFHDHEYTKIELPDLRTLGRVLSDNSKEKEKEKKSLEKEAKTEETIQASAEEPETPVPEEPVMEVPEDEKKPEEVPIVEEESKTDLGPPTDEDCLETDGFPERRGKKRVRILDSLKPSKKIKLNSEEEPPEDKLLPLEIIEKENLETLPEDVSPSKDGVPGEKTGGLVKGSPKVINGSVSSRALRMIALVPESTKGGQLHWDSQPKVEVLKCKKAPNVDKNSRASKMLALLSENVVKQDIEELIEMEEINSNGVTTPTPKTPTSTLKSPKSVKKRRSIRFDDAKNETVLYQTDTPPSQILEEKEKCRRNRSAEVILNFP